MSTRLAKYRDGRPYDGSTQYLDTASAKLRSCGKCGNHKSPLGFRMLRPWGMCCADCNAAAAAKKEKR